MFKVNNKGIRATPLGRSHVFIVNFEHVNAGWVYSMHIEVKLNVHSKEVQDVFWMHYVCSIYVFYSWSILFWRGGRGGVVVHAVLESGVQQIIMWNISGHISCVEGFILTLSWTGFYVIGATVMKELGRTKNSDFFSIRYFLFFN